MIIGIISYLPDNEQIRQQRLKYHRKQLEQLLKLDCEINIVAQNYRYEDFLENENIKYFIFRKGIGVSKARNILLRNFYRSNEDWMYMCDDDAYYYPYYDIDIFFDELKTTPQKFIQLDLIRGKFASKLPFKKVIYEEPDNKYNYCFFDENSIGTTALCIIKNFRKYYNKEFYYNEMDFTKGEGYEDKDFCCLLKLNRIKTHVLQTFIMNTYNYTDNSTLFNSYEDRMKFHQNNNSNIFKKYQNTDLFIGTTLNKVYRNYKVLIPRIKQLVIEPNLIPEGERKPRTTLF